jgi:hypothetical protein
VLESAFGVLVLQALTPLTIGRGRAAASALGALWGFGHSTGQLILGLVFVLLKVRIYCCPYPPLQWPEDMDNASSSSRCEQQLCSWRGYKPSDGHAVHGRAANREDFMWMGMTWDSYGIHTVS